MLQNGNRIEIKGRFQKRIYIKYDIRKKFVCQMIKCFIFQMVICYIVVLLVFFLDRGLLMGAISTT